MLIGVLEGDGVGVPIGGRGFAVDDSGSLGVVVLVEDVLVSLRRLGGLQCGLCHDGGQLFDPRAYFRVGSSCSVRYCRGCFRQRLTEEEQVQ